jgi:hypothetical protein
MKNFLFNKTFNFHISIVVTHKYLVSPFIRSVYIYRFNWATPEALPTAPKKPSHRRSVHPAAAGGGRRWTAAVGYLLFLDFFCPQLSPFFLLPVTI